MSQYQIAVLVGSLRNDSLNGKLANAIEQMAPDFSFKQLSIGDLPLYNQDDDSNPTESVKKLRADILSSHGILFVTAEYNRSIPGILKNAIDHASRPYGQSVWTGKPGGIIGISPGSLGTSHAQHHLRSILAYLDVHTLAQPEAYLQAKEGFFDDKGNIAHPDSKKFIQKWVDKYQIWIKQHNQRAHNQAE